MNESTRPLLLELADFLDQLPPERFDYSLWVGDEWKGAPDLSCGTTACAAGWATTLPPFQARGLHLGSTTWSRGGIVFVRTEHGPLWGIEAMAEILSIPVEDAAYLFSPRFWPAGEPERSPSMNASPGEVATHIRSWLSRHD